MASSGYLQTATGYPTSKGDVLYVRFYWSATQSGNTSTISWRVANYREKFGNGYVYNLSLSIRGHQGTIISGTTTGSRPGANHVTQDTTLLSGSFTLQHSNGHGAFSVNLSCGITSSAVQYYISNGIGVLNDTTTAVGNPTGPYLSTSQVHYNETITISCGAAANGTNNTVQTYRFYVSGTGSLSLNSYIDSSSTTISFNNTYRKNTTVYFWVQALGSAGINSSIIGPVSYQVKNSNPYAPSFSTSGTIRQYGNTSITINNLSASDPDGDSISYFAYVNSSSSGGSSGGVPISNGDTVSMSYTNHYLHIYCKDNSGGLSGCTYWNVPRNTAPVINGINYSSSQVTSASNGNNLIRYLNANANGLLNKTVSSYTWEVGTNNNWRYCSNESSFSNCDMRKYGTQGELCQIRLTVTDSLGETATREIPTNYYLLPELKAPSLTSSSSEVSANAVPSNYFDKRLKAAFSLPNVSGNRAPIKKMSIYGLNNNKTKFLTDITNSSVIFNFPMSPGESGTFYLKIEDAAGQVAQSEYSSTYTRLPTYDSNLSISPTKWDIFPKSSVDFIVGDFCPSNHIGKITYKVEISVDNGNNYYDFITFDSDNAPDQLGISGTSIATEKTGNTITYRYTGKNYYLFDQKLQKRYSAIYQNKNYSNVSYRCSIQNAFGTYGKYKYVNNCSIITISAPYFNEETFVIGRGFSEDGSINKVSGIKKEFNSKEDRYINPGEVIAFYLDNYAVDENDIGLNGKTDVQKYKVQFNKGITATTEWTDMVILPPRAHKEEGGKKIWYAILPEFMNNEQEVNFRIIAIDSVNEESKDPIVSNTYLIACRKVQPTYGISSTKIKGKELTIDLNITDFGGNGFGKTNFQRNGQEQALLKVSYSNSISFSNSRAFKEQSFLNTSLNQNLKTTFTFANDFIPGAKVYIKIELILETTTIYHNAYNTTKKTIPLYTIHNIMPVVSYRPEWVGINTNLPEAEEVLQVSSTEKKQKIVLNGENGIKIIINLADGKVDGLIIDGGTW